MRRWIASSACGLLAMTGSRRNTLRYCATRPRWGGPASAARPKYRPYVIVRSAKIWTQPPLMTRAYTFVFTPEPEGGFTVTCPALPGLVTYGETLQEARQMARDAMDGLIEVMLEKGEAIPESDAPTR